MPSSASAAVREETPPSTLRVGFLGHQARDWLGGFAEPVPLTAGEELPEGDALHALLVDVRPEEAPPAAVERTVSSARRRGVAVIAVERGEGAPWSAQADLRVGGAGDDARGVLGCVPVDPAIFNPLGFVQSDVAGYCAVAGPGVTRPSLERAMPFLAKTAEEEPVILVCPPQRAPAELPPGLLRSTPESRDTALIKSLRGRLGAIDHPGLHGDEAERAALLARLCAAGVPVAAAETTPTVRALLGERLAEALREATPEALADLDLRERISVAQRRAALIDHSLEARWRQIASALGLPVAPRRLVSVILSTRRESWLDWGLEQVARQTYQPRELIVCLHGGDFSQGVEDRLRERVAGPLEVVRVRSELTLGEALNAGVEAASGEYVTKMDDDDYYSADHLWDLVLALEYSGADLAGKAAEFVYLASMDLTLRRFGGDVETDSHRLAGGGMMARRGPLRELGGWPARSRGEDTVLVKTFRESGRRVHRTHGYGYILNRHMQDHTWNTYVDYFLVHSEREWRGLRFDASGIY